MKYRREDGCRAWLTYGEIPCETLRALLDEAGSAEAIYDRFLQDDGQSLRDVLKRKTISTLRSRAPREAMHSMMKTMEKHDIGILSINDEQYPDALRAIADPPVFLFYRGDPASMRERSLAIVGTRKATPQGMQATHDIARELSQSGVTIVSGLACGIDTSAHEGALEGETPCVGVCASGLDIDYPADSHELKERVLESGGVLISEFALGSPALDWHFHARNRIMSGLSRGVLMMEARIRSGTMLTVQHALDQGREVFAWPGLIGTEHGEAAHELLREGARFFTSAADVLEDLGWDRAAVPTRQEQAALPPLSADQRLVLSKLRGGEMSMDQLALATGLDPASLNTALTMLQLFGQVRSLPGKIFSII